MTRLKRKDIPRTKLENDTISNIGNIHVTLCNQNGDFTFCIDKIALPYLYKLLDLSFQIPLKIVIIELHIDKKRVSSWTWTSFFLFKCISKTYSRVCTQTPVYAQTRTDHDKTAEDMT